MKILLTLLLSVTLFLQVQSQQLYNIQGTVSGQNGSIPGATVQIQGSKLGAVADVNGKYSFENLESGVYQLEFRSVGYKPQSREVVMTNDHKVVNVTLEENSLGLDEVVVTGTMKPTFVKSSPVKVSVVTSEYMNTFNPAAASSIVEGVKLVNGVQEVVACGVCFTNSISINGLPGPYTAILMDGTPIYGNLASVYGLNGIPNMIIDRFEVIKGPSSTLYGSEAVAGVINIITKNPEDQPLLSVDVMATSHLESFGNISASPRIGNSNGFIGLNYAYINDFDDRNGDGFGDMANLDRYSLFTKWNISRKSKLPFSVAAKYYYEDRRNGVETYLDNRNYKDIRGSDTIYGESIYTNRLEIFGEYQFATKEDIKVNYSLSNHQQDSYYGADYYEAEQRIAFANFVWNKTISKHTLISGLTTRYQYYDDNTIATSDPITEQNRPDNQFIPGLFIQDEWKTSDKLTLLTGARLDHYQHHGLITSPRLNLKYKAGQWTNIRANFGTGFRIVNLFAEDHAFITGQRSVVISEELKPERSLNAALNTNHIYTLGNSQGSIDLDIYYTYFSNKILPDYSDPDKIIYANSDGYAVTKGIGANITHEFMFPLSINISGNIQRATQTEENGQGQTETSDIEFAPKWSGIFTANYSISSLKLNLGYTLRVTGPMSLPEVYDIDQHGLPHDKPRPTSSESYLFHNIQVSKELSDNLTLYGGAQNLFDYIQPVSPLTGYNDPNSPTGFSNYFDTAYAYAPIHGREFYLGIKWNLKK